VANERCGSWYIPPDTKSGSAYFKSTDGHTGQWDFSFRRLNLQILPLAREHGGYVSLIWRTDLVGIRASHPTNPVYQ
jgi:tRNA A64-2'-O-ribosylphosphate transferase